MIASGVFATMPATRSPGRTPAARSAGPRARLPRQLGVGDGDLRRPTRRVERWRRRRRGAAARSRRSSDRASGKKSSARACDRDGRRSDRPGRRSRREVPDARPEGVGPRPTSGAARRSRQAVAADGHEAAGTRSAAWTRRAAGTGSRAASCGNRSGARATRRSLNSRRQRCASRQPVDRRPVANHAARGKLAEQRSAALRRRNRRSSRGCPARGPPGSTASRVMSRNARPASASPGRPQAFPAAVINATATSCGT